MPDERFGGRLPHGFAVEMAGKEGVVAKFCVLVKRQVVGDEPVIAGASPFQ